MQNADDIASSESFQASRPTGAKPATIREVAALAGVSHQTVSRYLNQDNSVRPATVERIRQAMSELHYTPNLAARSLRSRRNYRVVVVVPDASLYFPLRILNGVAKTAQLAGYRMDVMALEGSPQERMNSMDRLMTGDDLAGVLAFAPLPAGLEGSGSVVSRVPIVASDAYDDNMRASGSFADGTATAQIVEYLHGLGHRHFFHVAGPLDWSSARNRKAAYKKAITTLDVHSHGIAQGDWSAASGYDAVDQILASQQVTAVVAANDQMAFGVMRALHDKGIAVPRTMSVFGWDDMAEAKFFVPSLSTVHMDLETQGAAGMARLIALIRGEQPGQSLPSAPKMHLVFRESCGPVRLEEDS